MIGQSKSGSEVNSSYLPGNPLVDSCDLLPSAASFFVQKPAYSDDYRIGKVRRIRRRKRPPSLTTLSFWRENALIRYEMG